MKGMYRLLRSLTALLLASMLMGATQAPPIEERMLDEMDDITPWRAVASDGVSASVHEAPGVDGGGSLLLEFDFARTAGYTAAARPLDVQLPDDYEISFWMRGEAGQNHFEVKFVDASGDNVWWYRRANTRFSGDWQHIRIKRRQIEFAWGPTSDKVLRHFASVEFVVSAGAQGGSGKLWFDRLALKTVAHPAATAKPTVQATTERSGTRAVSVLDGNESTAWRSVRTPGKAQAVTIDLQAVKEFGGVEIDWVKGLHAPHYSIDLSLDGKDWTTVREVSAGNGGRDSHRLPESEARWIRITFPDPGRDVAIAEVHVRDLEFGASANAFLQELAKRTRRGCYPRAYYDEQSYWTIVGVDGDSEEGLFSEDGAIEARKAGFSVEPFIRSGNRLLTWADVSLAQSLADGYLPIPSVRWTHDDVVLNVTALAAGSRGSAHTRVTYDIDNPTASPRKLTLALAVRPLQVNPPAQFLNTAGGASPIQDLSWQNGNVRVDGIAAIFPQSAPTAFVAVPFDADSPCEWLTSNAAATSIHDETGFASGALLYDIELEPGESQQVVLDLPQHASQDTQVAGLQPASEEVIRTEWREKLNRVQLDLPPEAQAWFDTLRTSLAHVLINRDGPGIQPGSRSYERSWIRDGAMTSEFLLRMGHYDVAKEFLLWYADYQFANGKVPCCVDVRGADPVPENDSGGEFLFLIGEIYRYGGDKELLRSLWPRVVKAVSYMDTLRRSERTAANRQGERRAFYGMMPASISHEGYSAKPMHSYWDNFWALTGYESAVTIARALDERAAMREFIDSRDEFRADLHRSLQAAMAQHRIAYLPGAAELGDFDATSTTIALSPLGEQQMLPPQAVNATFERYWKEFDKRRTDTSWDAYTPYELRNLAAFVRLGWRDRAQELLAFFMNDRRPAAWNQWAEVVGREVRKTRFIGDMPHGWVASDYGRSLLDMFAYERPVDETLLLMGGVPKEWFGRKSFGVRGLRTAYGPLSYSFKVDGRTSVLEIEKTGMPAGGIAVSWPERPKGTQTITSGSARWNGDELRVSSLPFRIEFAE
ncbi:discoidin domain-containing protein [Povalibacter sp.]|uniref:discoidin domain-containing protein n=1 Tax=Povalibacter sp. TaxID=1962978 RepID=UPI002F427E57